MLALTASAAVVMGSSAAEAAGPSVTKAASWLLASKLSLGLLLKSRQGGEELGNKMLTQAEVFANALGVKIIPFTPTGTTDTEILAETTRYLIKGNGANLGAALSAKYDQEHTVLFEVAVKSNLAILLYVPGDDFGMADIIQSRCSKIKLPKKLWVDVVNAMKKKKDQETIKSLIIKMHMDVAKYLTPA